MTLGRVKVTVAGVDGCKAGWLAVILSPGRSPAVAVFRSFVDLVASLPMDAIIAVDMPIGLPEFGGKGGRGPGDGGAVLSWGNVSRASSQSLRARPSMPIRKSFTTVEAWYAGHRKASEVARTTSTPPRGVSIQAFGIFSKIREIDTPAAACGRICGNRIRESHPEVAFCRLNGGQAMSLPKKIKGTINPAGMEERKALLCAHGYERSFLDQMPPKGAASDDFLDAAAMMLIAASRAARQGPIRIRPLSTGAAFRSLSGLSELENPDAGASQTFVFVGISEDRFRI